MVGGACFADMLQLINTPDNDFSGLFDLPFGALDSAVPPGPHPAPGTLSTFLGPSKPPPATPTGSVYSGSPGMPPFAPQPAVLPTPAPGVKEEAAVPSSQPQPGVLLAPSFVPASPSQFSSQPLVGYQNQHGFSGEDLGVRGGLLWGVLSGGRDASLWDGGAWGGLVLEESGDIVLCSMSSRAARRCGAAPAQPPACPPAAEPARGTAGPRAERGIPAASGPRHLHPPACLAPDPASAGKPGARGGGPSVPPFPLTPSALQVLLQPHFIKADSLLLAAVKTDAGSAKTSSTTSLATSVSGSATTLQVPVRPTAGELRGGGMLQGQGPEQ